MGNSSLSSKPSKPYADFPLYPHQNGQWAKKIKGKTYFFGTWDNWEAALQSYVDNRDPIRLKGRKQSVRATESGKNDRATESPSLEELVNVYIDRCEKRVEAGEMSQRTVSDYVKTLKRLAEIRGKHDEPQTWTPEDFAGIKEAFAQPVKRKKEIRGGIKGPSVSRRSSTTVDIDLRSVRAFLNWCCKSEYITQPRFGPSFEQTTAKQKRKKKSATGPRDLTADEIKAYLELSTVAFKGILLLGINGGMGAGDIGGLTVADYKDEWLNCPRQKTGMDRRIWLWPETRAAIDAHLDKRWKLNSEQPLFITTQWNAWVRGEFDAIGKFFGKLRDENNLRGTFYDLRRTFETVAEETLDFPCVKFCMGHAASTSDMSAIYRQKISNDRIQSVCEHVRTWLFGAAT